MTEDPTYEALQNRIKELERQLEEQQQHQLLIQSEKLQRFIEQAPAALAMFDHAMRYLAVSHRWIMDYGLQGKTIIGRSHYEIFPEIPEHWKVIHRRGLSGEVLKKDEESFVRMDGHIQWLQWEVLPWKRDDGTIGGILIYTFDITKRKQTEDKLKHSESFLRTLLRTIPDLIWMKDPKGVYLLCNVRFERFFGEREVNIIGKTDYDFVDKTLADLFRRNDKRAIKRGIPSKNEEEITFADDGHREILETIKTPVYTKERHLLGVLGIAHDITGHKQALKAQGESQERFEATFKKSPIPTAITKMADSKLTDVNDAWCQFMGFSKEEAIGHTVMDIYIIDAKIRTQLRKIYLEEGSLKNVELTITIKNGEKREVLSTAEPFWVNNEEFVVSMFIDITHRKLAEQERDRVQEQLLQSQKMEAVGRLAGGVAHDFNNMLSIINGYADIALEKLSGTDPLREDIEEILKAGQRSSELTTQLLAFARRQTVSLKVLDLNGVLENSHKMLQRLIGEDILLRIISSPHLWMVKMDPSQIDQILVNLSVNSRDAIKGVGNIHIETANVTIDTDYCREHLGSAKGEFVKLSFSDSGMGMDKKTQAMIFEPFYTTKDKGTGLGLSTIYGIIKQNKGFINVYSESLKGTVFKIYLPRFKGRNKPDITHSTPQSITGSETILVVEDEKQILDLCRKVLQSLGYKVITSGDPEKAIELFKKHAAEINLLLTDVVMPSMNGKDLHKKIMALCPFIKVLYMSGYTANVIAQRGVLTKGIQFIQKPFSPKSLAQRIREVLDQK